MMQEEMEFYQQHANTVRPKRTRKVIERDREAGHERLWMDYFSENPVYPEELFRRRFRMRKDVFLRVVDALGSHNSYFLQSVDAVGRQIFGETYLRRPNHEDITRLLQWGESRGFPGSNNDINVLNQSPVFNDVLSGNAHMFSVERWASFLLLIVAGNLVDCIEGNSRNFAVCVEKLGSLVSQIGGSLGVLKFNGLGGSIWG
ncbi:uncharacterized protein LOC130744000 [Lotus japonicus]|uniref:uncharacterized protein LOC130744000 n=1 Tax=Lotus japonicus TaxID=34305 RepID=UPI002583823B|nr:uncharacterized protein LOC130744000 [Lotus japonicus]